MAAHLPGFIHDLTPVIYEAVPIPFFMLSGVTYAARSVAGMPIAGGADRKSRFQPCVRYCKCFPKPVPRHEFSRRARYIHQYITMAIAKILNMFLIFAVAHDLERNGDFPRAR
jgi:hypothetical protein